MSVIDDMLKHPNFDRVYTTSNGPSGPHAYIASVKAKNSDAWDQRSGPSAFDAVQTAALEFLKAQYGVTDGDL